MAISGNGEENLGCIEALINCVAYLHGKQRLNR